MCKGVYVLIKQQYVCIYEYDLKLSLYIIWCNKQLQHVHYHGKHSVCNV